MGTELEGPYDWTIEATDHSPELKHELCTCWYDGPLSNIFRDGEGNGWVLHWGNRLANKELYILFPLSKEGIQTWTEGEDMHKTSKEVIYGFHVTIEHYSGVTVVSERKDVKELEDYFPQDRGEVKDV